MGFELPGKYYESNLLVTRQNTCYAVYKLEGDIIDFKSESRRIHMLNDDDRFLQAIKSDHVKVIGKPYFTSISAHHEEIKRTIKGDLAYIGKGHMDGVTDYLQKERGDEGNELEKYLLVKIKPVREKIKGFKGLTTLFAEKFYQIADYLGTSDNFPLTLLEAYKRSEEKMYNSLRGNVTRCNETDIEWLTRSPAYRGIGEPKLRAKKSLSDEEGEHWRPGIDRIIQKGRVSLSPRKEDLTGLCPGHIKTHPLERMVTVEHTNGKTSYQSFYAVSFIPDMVYPGNEWIYHLDSLGFPVEYEIDIDYIDNMDIVDQVVRRKKVIEDQIEHTAQTESVDREKRVAQASGDKIHGQVKETKERFTVTNINLCIYADSQEELERRKLLLEEYFDIFEIEIESPMSDQLKMFIEFLPGSYKQSTAFSQKISTKVIASTMLKAVKKLGSEGGFHIGTTGQNKKSVRIDPREASLTDFSPSMTSIGTLGGGKSLLMKFIAYMVAIFGGRSLIVDPKKENGNWLKFLPHLKGFFGILELSGRSEDRGKLDPFMVYEVKKKTGEEKEQAKALAYEVAVSVLSFLFDAKRSDDISLAITEACQYARDHEEPCMQRVIEYVDEYDKNPRNEWLANDFRKLHLHLEHFKSFKVTQLLFGDGSNEAISIDKPITILQIQGLTLPSKNEDPTNYTPEKAASLGVMIALTALIRKFAFSDRSIFKFIGMDEKWFYEIVEIGEQMIEEIVRQGRAINTGMHLIDQNADNFSSKIRNLIGIKFVYRTPDVDQARSALEYLKLEPTKENLDLVMEMPKRHVLMQDLHGRVGLVKVNLIFSELLRAFNTRPVGDENAA
ncbi:MAG: ATP-binding protein [Clostridia bacterium]|nr:ATP-binding protein [Clostridia bacterium]